MLTFLQAAFFVLFAGQVQVEPAQPTIHDSADERLDYMQKTGATYVVSVGDNDQASFRKEPVLRWTNPVSGVVDGGLFVWQLKSGRPVAVAQFFIAPGTESLWLHEFQSLALEPMQFEYEGLKTWTPDQPGVRFESVTGTARPAETRESRLVQMRQIARRLSVKDDFEGIDEDQLRLMTTPLVRYNDDIALDGALFTHAHGTDPELMVMIEMRKDKSSGQPVWMMALAPMTSYAIAVKLDEKDFWSVTAREAPHPINAIFKNYVFPIKR